MSDEPQIDVTQKRKGGRPRKVTAPTAPGGVSPDMAALISALTKAQAEAPKAQAEAFAKIQNPSNVVASGRSVFNPRGEKLPDYTMPRLKCEIHAPWKIHPEYHGLDREEVELFNLLQAGEYRVELNDGSTAKVDVQAVKNDTTGAIEKLRIVTNWTEEHKGKYPAMRHLLRQILGREADDVPTMKQELAAIERGELTVSV